MSVWNIILWLNHQKRKRNNTIGLYVFSSKTQFSQLTPLLLAMRVAKFQKELINYALLKMGIGSLAYKSIIKP